MIHTPMEILDSLNMDDFVENGKDIDLIMDDINDYLGKDVFDNMGTDEFVCYLRSKGYRIYEAISYFIG